jgi:hypothetical protein
MSPVKTAPTALTANDVRLRAQYLDEVLDVLYPGRVGDHVAEYIVVPNARRPRLLVPVGDRRIAAAAVRRYAEPQSRMARFKRDAVVAALVTGVSSVLLRDRLRVCAGTGPDDTIDAYLRAALGTDLRLSVHIGPARANRKPVLQLLTPDGQTLGFAKLGISALTRTLVRAEATALAAVSRAGLTSLVVPRVLHTGRWRDHEVLVQSALPVWHRRAPLTAPRLACAMREVAACCGSRRGGLRDSGYWTRLHGRLAAIAAHPEGMALLRAAERIVGTAGRVELTYGAWHGDWAPWNMASLADTLAVWDWERFTPGAPIGFDALHYALQRSISIAPSRSSTHDAAAQAVTAMMTQAPELLLPFGVVHRQAVEVTALLYLIDLATRYVADRQAEAGARLGVLGSWLLPVLVARVEAL